MRVCVTRAIKWRELAETLHRRSSEADEMLAFVTWLLFPEFARGSHSYFDSEFVGRHSKSLANECDASDARRCI